LVAAVGLCTDVRYVATVELVVVQKVAAFGLHILMNV